MWIKLIAMLCILQVFNWQCFAINFIDLPGFGSDVEKSDEIGMKEDSSEDVEGFFGQPLPLESDTGERELRMDRRRRFESPTPRTVKVRATSPNYRRHWLVSAPDTPDTFTKGLQDDKDENLKSKINMLVQQTMHDTEQKVKAIQKVKERHREKASYKVGFILSMIKKSRDVLNELFNVAVKHRDEWKALEQLKIFELIVHSNVDTTNLVRQLVEIHIMNLNTTSRPTGERSRLASADSVSIAKSRVVLL